MRPHKTHSSRPRRRSRRLALVRVETLEPRALLSTLRVTTTADSGSGSLRQAILEANASAGVADTITFDLPSSDPGFNPATSAWAIRPATALPEVTDPVTIDGTTQPGFDATARRPVIVLDGRTPAFDGLTITAGHSTVRGLAVDRFIAGIHLKGQGNNVLQGNFIGVDETGTTAAGNSTPGSPITGGILIESAENLVGGTTPGSGNLISGNDIGVRLFGAGATGNTVAGNLIGLDVTGKSALGNLAAGVKLDGASDNTIGGTAAGAGNVISGNKAFGVDVRIFTTPADHNVIQNNLIGTDVTGTAAVANVSDGLYVVGSYTLIAGNVISGNQIGLELAGGGGPAGSVHDNIVRGNRVGTDLTGTAAVPNTINGIRVEFSAGNTIGGASPGEGNVISGNSGHGIFMQISDDGNPTPGTLIQGNFIGTDRTGTHALGNGGYGITYDAPNVTVGGTAAGAGNVIGANEQGGLHVMLRGNAPIVSSRALVQGNAIGTDRSGTAHLGNQGDGIRVEASNNTIGGTSAGASNLIAFNAGSGVCVYAGTGTSILANSIHDNAKVGIDVGLLDGPTPNDSHGHDGANLYQNFPVFNAVTFAGGQATVSGTLRSTPDTAFTVQFYRSAAPSRSSYGEGESYLEQHAVTTDGAGVATFTITLSQLLSSSEFLTATATDPHGNTSEFSQLLTNLAVDEQGPADPVGTGQSLVFTTTVSNEGIFPSFGTVLTQTLPPGTHFVSATGGATPDDGVVRIPLGSVPAGGSATVTLVLTADVSGTYTSQVSIQNAVTDTEPDNDSDTASGLVDASVHADLGLVIVADAASTTVGRPVRFTVTVTNQGPSAATSVRLTDVLPTGVVLVGLPVASRGSVSRIGGVLVAELGRMAPGASASLSFVVTPQAAGVLVDRATATADEPGVDPTAETQVTVATSGDPQASDDPPPTTTPSDGPLVISLVRYGYHAMPTTLVLGFSAALDAAGAGDPANYTIVGPGGRRVRIASVDYDPATHRVTIHPLGRLSVHDSYRLVVNGTRPEGVRDAQGLLLDGARTGSPGSDFAATIDAGTLVVTGRGPGAAAALRLSRQFRLRHAHRGGRPLLPDARVASGCMKFPGSMLSRAPA